MGEFVKVSQQEGYAVITLDHPPVNALNRGLLAELDESLAELAQNDAVRAVVIHGAGPKAFAAGADISEFPSLSPAEAEAFARRGQAIFTRIEQMPKPVIAAVHGYALGGGAELALACDFRIAGESARFGQPEVNLGIIPGYGGTQRLARLVGSARAKWICMTGDPVPAAEALRMGLCDQVVPDDQLMETATGLAARLAGKAPRAVALIKQAIQEGGPQSLSEGLEVEARLFGEVFGTADAREGVDAFLNKRQPRWTGR